MESSEQDIFKHVKLATDIANHKIWVGNVIHDMEIGLNNAHGRIDILEANYVDQKTATKANKESLDRVEHRLEKAEDQRENFSNYIASEVRELKDTVTKLSVHDDERHKELVGHLSSLSGNVKKLSEQTEVHSSFISEVEAKEREEKYANEKVAEALAPKKALVNKIKMTIATAVTLAVLGVLGKLGWLAIHIDELIESTNQQTTSIK